MRPSHERLASSHAMYIYVDYQISTFTLTLPELCLSYSLKVIKRTKAAHDPSIRQYPHWQHKLDHVNTLNVACLTISNASISPQHDRSEFTLPIHCGYTRRASVLSRPCSGFAVLLQQPAGALHITNQHPPTSVDLTLSPPQFRRHPHIQLHTTRLRHHQNS